MNRPVEFSGTQFRDKTFKGVPLTTPATGFSIAETRAATEARPGLTKINDLRMIGCPEEIFSRLIARRCAAAGIKHTITDDERRAQAARNAQIIAADKEAADREHALLVNYGCALTY